jgi:hypothetical protein
MLSESQLASRIVPRFEIKGKHARAKVTQTSRLTPWAHRLTLEHQNPSFMVRELPEPTGGFSATTSGVMHPQPNVEEFLNARRCDVECALTLS